MKVAFYWLLAVVVTFAAIIYQRKTGPTYDKKYTVEVNGKQHGLKLIRSMEIGSGAAVKLNIDDTQLSAKLYYKRFLTKDAYTAVDFEYAEKPVNSFILNRFFGISEEKGWFAKIPDQPMAGKIQYYFSISDKVGSKEYLENDPIVVRFKGAVPSSILAPHIFLMFLAMFFGNLAGIMAVFRYKKFRLFTNLTLIGLLFGGMIMGPWVQWYAFGEAWAGVPFAWDLTDNKTLVAFLFWIVAFVMNRKKEQPVYTIVASVVMLAVYSIPHSMYGSQLDPETGEIIQGCIRFYF